MKKSITIILIWSLLFEFCGCYTFRPISKEELNLERTDAGIIITTNQHLDFLFEGGFYTIKNDTITGLGKLANRANVGFANEQKIGLADVESIKVQKFNLAATIVASVIGTGLIVLLVIGLKNLFKHPPIIWPKW